MNPIKYDVFISYSRKDYVDERQEVIPGNEVSKIKQALTDAGISYWFDEEGIYSGQNFVEKIVSNIEAAQIFVFLSTVNANASRWTCKEIASADEFGKHIIPVRIDDSPYNRKVLFRISDLDYIEYYSNPDKGISDLITSIKTFLEQVKEEETRRLEEERKKEEEEKRRNEQRRLQREQEEKRRKEEQEQLFSEIKVASTTLDNEETKLEIDRKTLLLKAERITDEAKREELKALIKPAVRGNADNSALTMEISILKHDKKELFAQIKKLEEQNAQLRAALENANKSHSAGVADSDDLKKWNWGAFVFTCVWGLQSRLYWTIIFLFSWIAYPIVCIAYPIVAIIFGIYGSRWSWHGGKWDSWEHFQRVQAKWRKVAIWALPVIIILYIFMIIALTAK